jgi:hypothetical protein
VRRYFLLVAEPPRGHGARRQFIRRWQRLLKNVMPGGVPGVDVFTAENNA